MKLEVLFFAQMVALVFSVFGVIGAFCGSVLLMSGHATAIDHGFWIDTSSWALPLAVVWESGRWVDGARFWQVTIQVLCFYWRAGSL